MDGWENRWMNGRINGWMGEQMDGWENRWMDGRMNGWIGE